MNGIYVPLGPVDDFPVIDDFTYEEVRENHCVATVANEVCRYLVEKAELEGKKYLPVCIPCYNEDFLELLKTLVSLMENFEFMQKKARLHDDVAGRALKNEFNMTIPIIVPIFDGAKALSPTMKEWINANFPLLLNEMEGKSEPGKIDVRISCSKWWYFCEDTLPAEPGVPSTAANHGQHQHGMGSPDDANLQRIANQNRMLNNDGTYRGLGLLDRAGDRPLEDDDKILYFYMCPIVKRLNHRKHNSHQWFFDSICEGLEDRSTYAFLTDCGTSYETTCISRLMYDIYFKTDLIGVTARQRVETPNIYFHPCEDSPYYILQGDHTNADQKPCWKCWATYVLSPCPLQGFEFEATLILNSAMFNLVEALPVMPGPCQLLNWQKMKEFKVVDEYFNLLFEGEAQKKLPQLHKSLKRMKSSKMEVIKNDELATDDGGKVSFAEFLRVNMRLAEDRILSFVCVFSTGFGTKWVPGATFYYQPEVQWTTLLTQRRRWLNGTFASFLFFFVSQRARARVNGGLFDQHKAGKNGRFVNFLWSLQLFQLILVIIAPAVFGSAGYIGIIECAKKWPWAYSWALERVYDISPTSHITLAEVWCAGFFVCYAVWTMMSYYAKGGRMAETLCRVVSIAGFFYMFPVYFAIWYSIITEGPDVVGGLVICGILLPIVIAVAESFESAYLYLLYLPWFMVLIIFFLVFVPGYSFARLWDTTWGNRATGKDSAINENAEKTMKFRNAIFSTGLVLLNVFLVWAFAKLFVLGYAYVIGFMFVVFCPVIIQLICAIVFLFIVLPMRNFYARPGEEKLAASGSLDFEMNDGRSVISRQDLRMGESNSIPANKYKSFNNNNGGTQAFISAQRDDSETNMNSSNNSVSESIDHRLSSV
jgi:cellulose synthase/poly-beta-1,6-N-acetylglucosamine synthase-like glycosyltransferase